LGHVFSLIACGRLGSLAIKQELSYSLAELLLKLFAAHRARSNGWQSSTGALQFVYYLGALPFSEVEEGNN
jgi:hypothetical protein